ncbi:hypothetical protein [Methylobacterium soli]|uniref:Uncharacterized protein n=1 Tax=Methylobacterium soli TaxID=553447 RepID=A0A6L3SWL7_9HYPH|nr:hypothetical protein [Methylobacterium soli]KAB1078249.1 hypothetical protein F6X53_15975 [Methylobacterium soli]GJE45539.1 hypothetical protein AEGHOMDF_4738 [Methylobacterium soli]
MRRAGRWLLRTLGAVTFLVLLNSGLLWAAGYALLSARIFDPFAVVAGNHYRRALPEEIGVTSLVAHGSDFNLLLFLVPIRQEACGGFAFRLSDETAAEIEAQGVTRLQSARVGRGYKQEREEHYYSYEPWRQTPVPASWMGDGTWAGNLACFGANARQLNTEAVFKAAREPGAYFTTGGENEVLVIPRLRLVVGTFSR